VLMATALIGCASGGGKDNDQLGQVLQCLMVGPFCELAQKQASPTAQPRSSTVANVRTQMGYDRTEGDGSLEPHLYDAVPDGPYAQAEVTVRYDAAGRLMLFEPGGVHAPGTTEAAYASLGAVDQPWLDVGSSARAGQPPAPFSSGPEAIGVLVANPHALDWTYQSFGVWNTTSRGGGAMHAASFGTATPASAVPASGSARFSGKLAGVYISSSGQGSSAAADLSVRADFSTRSLTFNSSGTITTRDLKTSAAEPGLNLGGTLTYAPGSNAFTGTLTNAGGTMSGTTSGRFYGPAAQELGGVFNLRAPATPESFTGAYGAKR